LQNEMIVLLFNNKNFTETIIHIYTCCSISHIIHILRLVCVVSEEARQYIYNTCALSKHMGNMCMRLRNVGKGEALPNLFPRFAPNTHIYLYASTVHMYCIYPAILNRK
jgi:hypothetical protein